MKRFLQIHEQDNVVVALEEFRKTDLLQLQDDAIPIGETIPVKHKIASGIPNGCA